jgi:hypothetical protein
MSRGIGTLSAYLKPSQKRMQIVRSFCLVVQQGMVLLTCLPLLALLAHSFRLIHGNHIFEFAATCASEHRVWTDMLASTMVKVRRAHLEMVAANPVLEPFDETTVSSVPIDPLRRPNLERNPIIASNRSHASTGVGQRQWALLGTSESQRTAVDLKLADVFSEACRGARKKDADTSKAAEMPTTRLVAAASPRFGGGGPLASMRDMAAAATTTISRPNSSMIARPHSFHPVASSTTTSPSKTTKEGRRGSVDGIIIASSAPPPVPPLPSNIASTWDTITRKRVSSVPQTKVSTDSVRSSADYLHITTTTPTTESGSGTQKLEGGVERNDSTSSSSSSSHPRTPCASEPNSPTIVMPPTFDLLPAEKAAVGIRRHRSMMEGSKTSHDWDATMKGWRAANNKVLPATPPKRSGTLLDVRYESRGVDALQWMRRPVTATARSSTITLVEASGGGGGGEQEATTSTSSEQRQEKKGQSRPTFIRRKSLKVFRQLTRMTPIGGNGNG